jgi:hypothetical protein
VILFSNLILGQLVTVALFLFTCYGIGMLVLRRAGFASVTEELALAMGIGSGILGTVVFVLGLLGMLHRGILAGAVVTAWLVALPVWRDGLDRLVFAWRGLSRRRRAVVVGSGIAGLAVVTFLATLSFYPPCLWDGIMYHLAAAKLYLQQHRLVLAEHLRFAVFPQLHEMHFVLALALGGDVAAEGVGYAHLLIVALSIVGWAKRQNLATAGWIAAAIWMGIPTVLLVASTCYIDVALAAYVTVSLHAFSNYWQTGERRWLVAAGLASGFGAATKYTALLVTGALGLTLVVQAARRRRAALVLIFALAAAAGGGGWYVRNWLLVSNPVYPFARSIFPVTHWNEVDTQTVKAEWTQYGAGKGIRALVTLPWNLAFRQKAFKADEPTSAFLFLLAPLGLLAAWRTRPLWAAAAILAPLFAVWFETAQIIRYLIPVFPFLALLCGMLALRLLERLPRVRSSGVPPLFTAGLCAACLIPGARSIAERLKWVGPPPVTPAQREVFLQRFPTYECYQYLNTSQGTDYRVFSLFDDYMAYYADGARLGNVFGPNRYSDVDLRTAQGLVASMGRINSPFLILPRGDEMFSRETSDKLRLGLLGIPTVRHVFSCTAGELFQISTTPATRALGPELLTNTGLEEGGAKPAPWILGGTASVDIKAAKPHSGLASALIPPGPNEIYYCLKTTPGALYQLDFWGRSNTRAATGRILVYMYGTGNEGRGVHVVSVPIRPDWEPHQVPIGIPFGVTNAILHVVAAPEDTIWCDDFSLREVRYDETAHP